MKKITLSGFILFTLICVSILFTNTSCCELGKNSSNINLHTITLKVYYTNGDIEKLKYKKECTKIWFVIDDLDLRANWFATDWSISDYEVIASGVRRYEIISDIK